MWVDYVTIHPPTPNADETQQRTATIEIVYRAHYTDEFTITDLIMQAVNIITRDMEVTK